MYEIARKVFYSLNKENNMYYVLNDQNFIASFYCETLEKAIERFEKGEY